MWVWSKLSAMKWEDSWEERFHGNPNAVITHLKGGKSLRIDVYCEKQAGAQEIAEQFGGSVKQLADQNWVALSAEPGPPIKIRDTLLVTEERDKGALEQLRLDHPGRHVVSIPAEMAFGTGDHPTTAGCLRLLSDEAKARRETEWKMLDVGCGSGVLAIAARLLGAHSAEAFDFDPKAVEVAQQNVDRNEVEDVLVREADVLTWTSQRKFQVIAANLYAGILSEGLPRIRCSLACQGRLILSGILKTQWDTVEEVLSNNALAVLQVAGRGKWVVALAAPAED